MKFLLSVSVCAFFCLGLVKSAPVQLDGTDINDVLNDPTKRDQYIDCLKGQADCTKDGKKLKDVFKQVLVTGETNSDEAGEAALKLIEYLAPRLPDVLKELTEIFNPKTIWQRIKTLVRKPYDWVKRLCPDNDDQKGVVDATTPVLLESPPASSTTPNAPVTQTEGGDGLSPSEEKEFETL